MLEGKLVRSRAKWIFEGEKPTSSFCNLENRNYTYKIMNKLYSKNGSLLTDQRYILTETANHYKDLYSQKDTDSVDLSAIINNDNFTKLTIEECLILDQPLQYGEYLSSLKHVKSFFSR